MDDPRVEQIMRTGYPSRDYIDYEQQEEAKLRDYKEGEIKPGETYLEFPNGDLVKPDDLEEYALRQLGAELYEH